MTEKNEDKLPHLAWEIKSGLDLAEKGKQDRIKGLVDAAVALREARSLITADIKFSKWCATNEIGNASHRPKDSNQHCRGQGDLQQGIKSIWVRRWRVEADLRYGSRSALPGYA
jgi:hypothetical protein